MFEKPNHFCNGWLFMSGAYFLYGCLQTWCGCCDQIVQYSIAGNIGGGTSQRYYYIIINIASTFIRKHCCLLAWSTWTNSLVCKIYKKYNWQSASTEHDNTRVWGRRAGPSATASITSLSTADKSSIILVDFNLTVSTPTAKPATLIPRQIFQLYGIHGTYSVMVPTLWYQGQ